MRVPVGNLKLLGLSGGDLATTAPIVSAEKEVQPKPLRCLILANAKAGSVRSLRTRLLLFGSRCWQKMLFKREPVDCDSQPECVPMLARCASTCGIEAHVEVIPAPHQIPERIRTAEHQGYDVVVAAGGDGTVHSIAQGMVHSNLRMGIIPMGTANNIARVLGLPLKMEDAMAVLASGEVHNIDVGRVAGTYFLEAAGVGLFADAFAAFGKDEPRKWQVFRLLKVLGPMLWNPPIRNLELKLDGVAEKDAAIWIAVSNSSYIGDNMPLAPEASLEDGQFDVIIVGAMDRVELLQFGIALARGKHLSLPKVRGARAKIISIERVHRGHRALPVHADAEIVGFTPTLLETLRGAIQMIVPQPEDAVPITP